MRRSRHCCVVEYQRQWIRRKNQHRGQPTEPGDHDGGDRTGLDAARLQARLTGWPFEPGKVDRPKRACRASKKRLSCGSGLDGREYCGVCERFAQNWMARPLRTIDAAKSSASSPRRCRSMIATSKFAVATSIRASASVAAMPATTGDQRRRRKDRQGHRADMNIDDT